MSDETKDGGPAFPRAGRMEGEGMSLRDYFAAAALTGLIAKIPLHDRQGTLGIPTPAVEEIHGIREEVARSAYDYADAMLAERSRR